MSRFGFSEIVDFIWARIEEAVGDESDADSSTSASEDGSGDDCSSGASSHGSPNAEFHSQDDSDDVDSVVEDNQEGADASAGSTPVTFEAKDYGDFMLYDVAVWLSKGMLDPRRYEKLKKGFLSLLS